MSQVRPQVQSSTPAAAGVRPESDEPGVAEQWAQLVLVLDTTLREMRSDSPWQLRLKAVQDRARRLFANKPDASLYHLIYLAGNSTERYSSHHSLLCMLISHAVAKALKWTPELITSLDMANLTMNASMRTLQDALAAGTPLITGKVRAEIDAHAEQSAQLLLDSGATDNVCVEIVRLHHDDSRKEMPLADLDEAQRAARLVRRVDMFAAKLSKRANRAPVSPVKAARDACMGADGTPDEIGGALLATVGLYPPGSCVELVSSEIGLVVARGKRANQPRVGVLVLSNGAPLGLPLVRDCEDPRYAIRGTLAANTLKTRPPHAAMLAAS